MTAVAAAPKSVLNESRQIERAAMLIKMGARMQVLESETDLSYERLLRLYKEVAGKSPSKGQLPFSTDWFMTWQPNIHSSLFLNIHEYLNKVAAIDEIDTVEQQLVSHHYDFFEGRATYSQSLHRYVWPSELDLMADHAGLTRTERWADWSRSPFTEASTSHVSVWVKR